MKLNYIFLSMQQYFNVFKILIASISLILIVSSCSFGGETDPSRFYMLDASIKDITTKNFNKLRLGVGPFTFPGYIDRPQIVTKTETAELEIAEYDRWAEPIGDMFVRTLSSNLKALTGSPYIASHPWPRQATFEYRVKGKIINFENNTKGDALLIVQWGIYEKDNETNIKAFHSKFTATAVNTNYPERIAALNDTLAQFASEIINQIN